MSFSLNQKRQLLLILSLLLCAGFLITSLISYNVSRASLRQHIISNELPLTSDNIYSEIQRDLLRPVFISSLMANDAFLRNWVINGERDPAQLFQYLNEIKTKYNTFTSFFVSEKTLVYYYFGGILKKVKADEPRDAWYFRVRKMKQEYEINVDPDMAHHDTMTIFVNHRVFDFNGNYIGATGVGLSIKAVSGLIESYHKKFNRTIYFVNREGDIVLNSKTFERGLGNIRKLPGIGGVADKILNGKNPRLKYDYEGNTFHLNIRFIPELNWFLVVEQEENSTLRQVFNALILNLILCLLVTAVAIALTRLSINAYQRKLEKMAMDDMRLKQENSRQQDEIARQHAELHEKNIRLEKAMAEVKKLSGLLPVCSSCKKIRDADGVWETMEDYLSSHSEAEIRNSVCPECSKKLYPDLVDNE